MSVSFPEYRKGKATRDVTLNDTVTRDFPTRPIGVAAATVIAPDQLLVVNTTSPLTARPAVAGDLLTSGGSTFVGISNSYATSSATDAGSVIYKLPTEFTTVRMVVTGPAPVVGGRYDIVTSVVDGYTVQNLDTSAIVATSRLLVDEYDADSKVAAILIV